MRLGLTSWNPATKLLAAAGLLPTPLLVTFWGMASSRCVLAAVELGVFDAVSGGPKTAAEVAAAIGCDEVGVGTLLNALSGFGYVRRRHGRYSNRAAVRRWLEPGSRFPLGEAFGLFEVLWDDLSAIEPRLRQGGARDFHGGRDDDFWRRYERALAAFSKLGTPEIVRRVRFDRPPGRLLDVGGGHGAYSVAFCRRYPELSADVIDLPGAAAIGRALVAEAGLSDRIAYREADMMALEWGSGYDVVLLFNVVHTVSAADAPAFFAAARSALRPGGTLVLLDSAYRASSGDVDMSAGANELLFWVINGTRAYPEPTMVGWMEDAGFTGVRTRHLASVPQAVLATGRA